jgi:hypothetical protein
MARAGVARLRRLPGHTPLSTLWPADARRDTGFSPAANCSPRRLRAPTTRHRDIRRCRELKRSGAEIDAIASGHGPELFALFERGRGDLEIFVAVVVARCVERGSRSALWGSLTNSFLNLDQADHLSWSLRQSSSLRRSAISSAIAGVFALAIGLTSAVTSCWPSTSTGKSSGGRGFIIRHITLPFKRKSRAGITPSGFSSNCQAGRFRCQNDNIRSKGKVPSRHYALVVVSPNCGASTRTSPSPARRIADASNTTLHAA